MQHINLHNAVIEKVETRKDHSLKLIVGTPELPPEDMVQLFQSVNKESIELTMPVHEEDAGKTPSQRLRAVLYVLWEQGGKEQYPEFDMYYRAKMEHFINAVKDKII